MKKIAAVWLSLLIVGWAGNIGLKESRAEIAGEVREAGQQALEGIRAGLQEKMKQSGTLDLFDKTIEKVRNLRVLSFPDTAENSEQGFTAVISYRDVNNGDVVLIEALAIDEDGQWTLKDLTIKEVQPLKKAAGKEEYSDEEIQAFMKSYLDQQVKFTDNIMLFDEEKGKMRNLQLQSLNSEIRHLGVYSISRAVFADVDSGETIGVDISVMNNAGELSVDALRIRSVEKQ